MAPSRSQKRRLDESAATPADTGPAIADEAPDAISLGLVEVRDTETARGQGLFAVAPIALGTYLGDYTGEVLTQEAYLARYPNEDAQYVLEANTDYNIDAADKALSSLMRYVNHSAAPNCYYDVRRQRRQRQKRVSFYTSRAIQAGEELYFDYGKQYWTRGQTPL